MKTEHSFNQHRLDRSNQTRFQVGRKMTSANYPKTYRNVMEVLVVKEVERQLKQLPANLARYIEPSQVITFALNHLPPLYASSEEGWQQQCHRAEQDLQEKIQTVVRQSFAAIQRDPLRSSTPLPPPEGTEERIAHNALNALQELLLQGDLTWNTMVETVRQTLVQAMEGELTQAQTEKITRRQRKRDRYRGL
ncbi:late competence development ComFB family protein [Lusitaniella coriacea]|nr:late competence development ComFB family protein [Lusitaniella coriacea]